MKNPLETFMLVFVIIIMIVGIYVSLNAQKDLRDLRYFDATTNIQTKNIG